MASDDKIIDWRSTGRRKARRALFEARVPFKCVDCGKTTIKPPADAPRWFEELWPEEARVLSNFALQADHESKDLRNNSIEDLNWRCSTCHKEADKKTAKGVSQKENQVFDLF